MQYVVCVPENITCILYVPKKVRYYMLYVPKKVRHYMLYVPKKVR